MRPPIQRRAAERLTGRRAGSGSSLSVSLDEIDRIVRSSGAAEGGLAEAVVLLTGPVHDLRASRAASLAAWAAAFAGLDEVVDGGSGVGGRNWRYGGHGSTRPGWRGGWCRHRRRLVYCSGRSRMPSAGSHRPGSRSAGSPRNAAGTRTRFDEGRPAGTLVLSAARALAAVRPLRPRSRRRAIGVRHGRRSAFISMTCRRW